MIGMLSSMLMPAAVFGLEIGRWVAGDEFMSVLANFFTGIFTALAGVLMAPFFGA